MRVPPVGFMTSLFVLLTTSPASATSFAPPQRHDVFSPNRLFVLDADPGKKLNTVYATSDRTKPLWSFPGVLWFCFPQISNDGTVVAIVGAGFVQAEDLKNATAIEFINKDGVFKSFTVAELCPHPPRTQDVGPGPIGYFWRTWHTGATSNGETVTVVTTGGWTYEFRLSDGEMLERRLNPSAEFQWWFWARVFCGLAVTLFVFAVIIRRRRQTTNWPRVRRALLWGVAVFLTCMATGVLAAWAIADDIQRESGDTRKHGSLHAINRHPEASAIWNTGVGVTVIVSTVAGLYTFTWVRWRRRAVSPPSTPIPPTVPSVPS